MGSGGNLDLDFLEQRPRSDLTSRQERLYRNDDDEREFGENNYFVQRYSGFFVPPVTSLYTFAIRSDDLSRLYLSPNHLPEDKEIITYSPTYTSVTQQRWDFYPSQMSEPIYLEAGEYYYIEALHNQFPGPWDLGIAAKIHSLDHNSYPYDSDNEVQLINISSTVVREQHVSCHADIVTRAGTINRLIDNQLI